MENLYGIGITNRYQLFLNEDEDPLEVLKVQEQEKELKKKTKLSEKENKGKQQEAKGKPVNVRKGIKETQNIKSQDQQHKAKEENVKVKGPARVVSDRKFSNENREERNNQRNRSEKPVGPGGDFHREDRGGERRFERRSDGEGPREGGRGRPLGTGRGMGRGRGRGGRGGFDGRGKREFDRQSGSDKTGIKAVDKRDGAGAHNWGSHRDAIEDLDTINRQTDDSGEWGEKTDNEVSGNDTSAEIKETTEGQNGVDAAEEGETPAQIEEERKELTLDEWKALKGNRSKPQYNLRKAGEGEDLSQWKKMYALQKKKEEEEEEEEEEYDSSDYPQRVGRQKHVLDIEFTFADARVGGRGRGGRGAGRGAPRGGSRGPPRGTSSDNGTSSGERDTGSYNGPRNSRPSAPKLRERDAATYGGPRSSRQTPQAPKVDDEHDFPSLG
ncbi:plasminogen activator inhibitor 1 RNA-binding protein-like [Homalodisca vitripennis]|uniref:plasminogen activator inhibitor 1 RNA-binding protein-like n=1 Tax=Homalodisca vitripennis TaxID=197043 RepID=UPI001EEA98B5|nr:plasminogen activator inhibitor 1 RNA-binding protein-like [Homalodisca vitripennis]